MPKSSDRFQIGPRSAPVYIKKFFLKICQKEYKDVFLNKKCSRHSRSSIQSKNHRIGAFETKKSLFCFDDKIYILDNGTDVLALGAYR